MKIKKKGFKDFTSLKSSKIASAKKVSEWIISSILKLDDKNLIEFKTLIDDELEKRGYYHV